MLPPAKVNINALTCQGYCQYRHLPKLSSMALPNEAIVYCVARRSIHRCHSYQHRHRLQKLSLIPLLAKAIINALLSSTPPPAEAITDVITRGGLSPWDVTAHVASPIHHHPTAVCDIQTKYTGVYNKQQQHPQLQVLSRSNECLVWMVIAPGWLANN